MGRGGGLEGEVFDGEGDAIVVVGGEGVLGDLADLRPGVFEGGAGGGVLEHGDIVGGVADGEDVLGGDVIVLGDLG